ncbi:PEP-CTERM sorting domain-containing protein [Rhodoferax sp. TBRC 17198]|uniref:PEP-CTERM sorting domain-containing protein n=1 Tax=Rhodoferax potami TaxID=3068338 RepID=UPI0028BEEDB4|nr:PEP-CTERM sorting domain-containing protein [Rhodoferax sp. TBRC 17198]MDT7521877.1 PEP-CTERM sorting domain-containing protein [Rhodoferax sp. TBRC 17198]
MDVKPTEGVRKMASIKKHFVCVAVAALLAGAGASAQTAKHQYRLDGTLSDDFGGPALVASGGTLNSTDYVFGRNQGLTLTESLGSVYTIDLSFSFDSHGGWQKIVDFSNLSSDIGMYTLGTQYQFFNLTSDIGAAPAVGVAGRLTLTRDASSLLSIYSNGTLLTSFSDQSAADLTGRTASFFIDDFPTGQSESGTGKVNYIRTYDTALSAIQVASLASPLAPVPEPETYALLLAGLGIIGAAVKRRKAMQA